MNWFILTFYLVGLVAAHGFITGLGRPASGLIRHANSGLKAIRGEISSEAQNVRERTHKSRFLRNIAKVGLLGGTFLPGKAVAAPRAPAAVMAKENVARQNPRDVWSGAKRGLMSEKPSSASQAKIPLYHSRADKVSATGTFVSAERPCFSLWAPLRIFFPPVVRLFPTLTSVFFLLLNFI